jgi:hypothetical protein
MGDERTWPPETLLGAYTPWAKREPVKKAHTNRVATHEENCLRTNSQLTPFRPSQAPTPMMAPVMHWEEEVGRPYLRHTCSSEQR